MLSLSRRGWASVLPGVASCGPLATCVCLPGVGCSFHSGPCAGSPLLSCTKPIILQFWGCHSLKEATWILRDFCSLTQSSHDLLCSSYQV